MLMEAHSLAACLQNSKLFRYQRVTTLCTASWHVAGDLLSKLGVKCAQPQQKKPLERGAC